MIYKLQLHKILNFVSKHHMESYIWITIMLTITKFRLNSCVMLSKQIFARAHLWQVMTKKVTVRTLKTAMCTFSEYTKTIAFGQIALQKHSTFSGHAYFQKSVY